jgi:hypothetical protein
MNNKWQNVGLISEYWNQTAITPADEHIHQPTNQPTN